MRMMYKNGQSKPVHNAFFAEAKADGWSFTQETQNVRQEVKETHEEKASQEASEEKEVKLTKTHKKALELGLEIEDENGLIHHKTLAKQIREALEDGNED